MEGNPDQVKLLHEIAQLYTAGAEVDWEEVYVGQNRQKVSLPQYSFEKKRCWVEYEETEGKNRDLGVDQSSDHPLFTRCLSESLNQDVYLTQFSVEKDWVLREHVVNGHYIIPGTTYLEMARTLGEKYYPDSVLHFTDVVFISPLAVAEGEVRETQTIIMRAKDHLEFIITSRTDSTANWMKHAEGKIYANDIADSMRYSISELQARFDQNILVDRTQQVQGVITTGPRWKNVNKIYYKSDELLAEFELPEEFQADLELYGLHPALLDNSVNLANRSVGEGLYLPFSYKHFELSGPMPGKFYTYIRKKDKGTESVETISFDITLMNEAGEVFGEITDYTIKKVNQVELQFKRMAGKGNLYHQVGWIEKKLYGEKRGVIDGTTLIFQDEKELGAKIAQHVKLNGRQVIMVRLGAEYQKVAHDQYVITGCYEDYERLFTELTDSGLTQILHLQTIKADPEIRSIEALDQSQEAGVYSLFYLTRTLLKLKFKQELDIVLISDYVNEVTKTEKWIHPEPASLFGFGKVVGREYSNLLCRCIDLDDETTIDSIIAELNTKVNSYQVAYRHGVRYVEEFRPVDLTNVPVTPFELKEQGVYLITGGTGGLGLEFARYLSSHHKVNLALLSRSHMPSREKWHEILTMNEDQRLVQKIAAMQELEARGAEVAHYRADVANMEELKPVIAQLREKYGRINGVIHAAGVAGDGFIIRKEQDVLAEVINPKIRGTWILDHLLEADHPDFFIMFSSITSIIGNPGQGDYTAANAYLDAYLAYMQKQGKNAMTVNWSAWKEIGMAVNYGVNQDAIFKAISTQEAMAAFEELIHKGITKAVIGELNYEHFHSVIDQFPVEISNELKINLEKKRKSGKQIEKSKGKKQITDVIVKGVTGMEENSTEIQVARIWARVLGLDEVDVYSSFYDLGGDSILATHLAKEMEEEFAGLIDISDIFTYPSVHEIATYIDKQRNKGNEAKLAVNSDEEEMTELLLRLSEGEISMEEVEKLLA